MGNHWRDLIVWQKSHALVKNIYKILSEFPANERFCLTDQLKRASVSVPTNIVEGHLKASQKEFKRYLFISRGSLEELRYLLLLSHELNYLSEYHYKTIEKEAAEISFILNKLIQSLDK